MKSRTSYLNTNEHRSKNITIYMYLKLVVFLFFLIGIYLLLVFANNKREDEFEF